jgi:predicted RNase H-like HicB family nuclease
MMRKYPIEVFWSEEDGGYIAIVPDLAGCSAWGKTESEAIREARDAIEAWVKAAKSAKRSIPEPSRRGDDTAYSGKFLMRVPKRLHADMARAAKAQGVSLNQYLLYLLTEKHVQNRKAA